MDSILTTMVFLTVMLLAKQRLRQWLTPIFVFGISWLGAIWINRIPQLELSEPRPTVYVMVGLSGAAFAIGFLLLARPPSRASPTMAPSLGTLLAFGKGKSRRLMIANSALTLILGFIASKTLLSLGAVGGEEARRYAYENPVAIEALGRYGGMLWQLVLVPLPITLFPLCIARYLQRGSLRGILVLIHGFLNLILTDAATVARAGTIAGMLVFLFALMLVPGLPASDPRLRKARMRAMTVALGIIVLCGVLPVLVASWMRTTALDAGLSSWDRLQPLLVYLGGPVTALDYYDSFPPDHHFYYSLGGFCEVANVASLLIPGLSGAPFVRSEDFQGSFIIGTQYFNALYTWCLYPYLDFGFAGVVLVPLVFGLVLGYFYGLLQRTGDCADFGVVLYLTLVAVWTIFDWRLQWCVGVSPLLWGLVLCLRLPQKPALAHAPLAHPQTAAALAPQRAVDYR